MRLLDKYIAKTVLVAIGYVTLTLVGLQIFILFVNQIDEIGKADFTIIQAALYILLQMPYQVYLFFPLASLLGCLIGLSIMAHNHELVVMRASGMSVAQVTGAVLKASCILILIVTILGETVIPQLSRWSNNQKMQALYGGQTLKTANGVWLRNGNNFVTIGSIISNNKLQDVYQFHFNAKHHLTMTRKIREIIYVNGVWQASDIAETIIKPKKIVTHTLKALPWDVSLKPGILRLSVNEPDELTLFELHQYLRSQQENHQSVLNYQLAYWRRLMQPLAIVVMALLAIPFIFGPLRSSTIGIKIITGATVGFGFHMINRFLGPISQVLQWPTVIAVTTPIFIFAMLGLYLMSRVK